MQCTIEHPAVQKIHLLQQAKFQVLKELPELRDPDNKVQTRVINRRILYHDAILAVNSLPHGSIALITNADIYPGDGSDFPTVNLTLMPSAGIALTRYEDPCTPFTKEAACDCRNYIGCHDSYIFRSPLPIRLIEGNTTQFRFGGLWGGENVFIHTLKALGGLQLLNLCYFIRTHHVHCSHERTTQDSRNILKESACATIGGHCQSLDSVASSIFVALR